MSSGRLGVGLYAILFLCMWASSFTQGTPPVSCSACVFGPQQYTRSTSTPRTEPSAFAADPEADYLIDIDDLASQGADGSVTLNDIEVLAPRAPGEEGPRHLRRPIALRPQNTLAVRLTGKPGSTFVVQILGGAKSIGAAGGTIRVPGGAVRLDIPPAALSTETEIRIAPAPGVDPPPGLEGITSLGQTWSLQPNGLRFDDAATITVGYRAVLGQIASPDAVGLVHWDPAGSFLDVLSADNDVAASTLSANIASFSNLSVVAAASGFSLYAFRWVVPVDANEPTEMRTWSDAGGFEVAASSVNNILIHHVAKATFANCPARWTAIEDQTGVTCLPRTVGGFGAADKVDIYISDSEFPDWLPTGERLGEIATAVRHQIGHALGIGHTWQNPPITFPPRNFPQLWPVMARLWFLCRGCVPPVAKFNREGLHQMDIDAVRAKYGPPPPQLHLPHSGLVVPQNDPLSNCELTPGHERAGLGYQITFNWTDVPGVLQYHLVARREKPSTTLLDVMVTSSSYLFRNCGAFVADELLTGWSWQVQSFDGILAGRFSAPNSFSFEACRLFDDSPCDSSTGPVLRPDLTVEKIDSPDPVLSGAALTYVITVRNIGFAAAANVRMTDPLPAGVAAGSCSSTIGSCQVTAGVAIALLGAMKQDSSAVVTINATAPTVTTPTVLVNRATVSTTTVETNVANNQSTATTTVNPVPVSPHHGGPPGAFVPVMLIDSANPNIMYIGTGGGVFKSTNRAATWFETNSGLPTALINALVLEPIGRVLYAGTFNGISRSVDGALSWTTANTGLTTTNVQALAVDMSADDALYTGTRGGGVFKSADGAAHWTAANTGLTSLNISAIAAGPSGVYAGTDDAGMFVSTDGGAHWTPINTGLTDPAVQWIAIDATNPSVVYVTTLNGGVFKSVDAGLHWMASNAGLTRLDVRQVAIDPANAATLYAATFSGVFKSVDGTATWTFASTGQRVLGCCTPGAFSIAIDPTVPGTVFAGVNGDVGVFKSTNGAATWTPSAIGINAASVSALVVDPSSPSTIYAATQTAAVFKSTNRGSVWAASATGFLTIIATSLVIDPTAPATLYAGTNGTIIRSVYKTVNGGATWVESGPDVTSGVLTLAMDPVSPSTIYAGTAAQGVFKTQNGGADWAGMNIGLTNLAVQVLTIDPTNPAMLYAGTRGGGIFRSTNGGTSWAPINSGVANLDVLALAVDPSTPATLYAATNGGGIFKSNNGGTTWTAANAGITTPLLMQSLAIDPTDPQVIYAGRNGVLKVFKSVNGGATWSVASNGLPPLSTSTRTIAIDPTHPAIVYVGTTGEGVFVSGDGGASWQATGLN